MSRHQNQMCFHSKAKAYNVSLLVRSTMEVDHGDTAPQKRKRCKKKNKKAKSLHPGNPSIIDSKVRPTTMTTMIRQLFKLLTLILIMSSSPPQCQQSLWFLQQDAVEMMPWSKRMLMFVLLYWMLLLLLRIVTMWYYWCCCCYYMILLLLLGDTTDQYTIGKRKKISIILFLCVCPAMISRIECTDKCSRQGSPLRRIRLIRG